MNRTTLDSRLLFATRITRLFCYGFLSLALALYLAQVGLADDRIGRRKMLILGALLLIFAGLVFAFTRNPILLMVAAIIGVVSPSGNEIGPFLSIEQRSEERRVGKECRSRW